MKKKTLPKGNVPEIIPVVALGGYLVHAKIEGKWAAVCGYAPSAPNTRMMRDRSGWRRGRGYLTEITCKKCLKKLEKLREDHPQ